MKSIHVVNNNGTVQIESALRIEDEKLIAFIKDPQNRKFINALTNDLGIAYRLEEGEEETICIIVTSPDSNRFDPCEVCKHVRDLHVQFLNKLDSQIQLAEREGKHEQLPEHEEQSEQELTDEEKDLIDFLDMLRPIIILV